MRPFRPLWCALVVLASSLAGCSQSTCVVARVLPWDGKLVDGGTATSPDPATCDQLCGWTVACAPTDGGVQCPAYCVP